MDIVQRCPLQQPQLSSHPTSCSRQPAPDNKIKEKSKLSKLKLKFLHISPKNKGYLWKASTRHINHSNALDICVPVSCIEEEPGGIVSNAVDDVQASHLQSTSMRKSGPGQRFFYMTNGNNTKSIRNPIDLRNPKSHIFTRPGQSQGLLYKHCLN